MMSQLLPIVSIGNQSSDAHYHRKRDVNSILPYIDEVVHTKTTQLHVIRLNIDYTNYLNPGQTAVAACDQPLYALKMQLLWELTSEMKGRIFPFLGPLHIEMTALKCHGDLIRGTGLEEIVAKAGFDTIGLSIALADANSIKKSRYIMQVVSCVMYSLMIEAYKQYSFEQSNTPNMEEWIQQMKEHSDSFKFWSNVLDFQKVVLCFVRSLREANFYLFVASLDRLCSFFFALDHTHYARWGTVFVNELKLLGSTDPNLHEQFVSGFFVARKSDGFFNNIGFDHFHEANNKTVKSRSGYSDLFNKEEGEFLRKLEIVTPGITSFLEESQGLTASSDKSKEESEAFSAKFMNDCVKLKQAITTNPFSDTPIHKLNTAVLFSEETVAAIYAVFTVGKNQKEMFIRDRLVIGKLKVMDKIPKNSLALPGHSIKNKTKSSIVVNTLTTKTLIKLREATSKRHSLAIQVFESDFTGRHIYYDTSINSTDSRYYLSKYLPSL